MSLPRSPLGRFGAFAVVGCAGFVVDATVLSTLVHVFDWHHYTARAVSFTTAVTATWYLNRDWVFTRTSDGKREYGAYFGVQTLGAAINLGTYALVIAVLPSLASYPVLPLAAGAALALVFNYAAARRWVFAASSAARNEE